VSETALPPMLDAAVTFGRVLRRMGLPAGPDRVVEFVRAVEELDVTRREDVYWAGKVTLCSRPEDLELYDRAFQLFWDGKEPRRIVQPPKFRLSLSGAKDSAQPPKKTVEKSERGEEAVRLHYSPVNVVRKKDFANCTPEEFAELYRLMADLNLSGDLRKSRRLGPAPRGRRDARRTLRDALRTGGEPLRHRYRKARNQPRRVVLLCDVSGSMASYSRALLRFMHASVASG